MHLITNAWGSCILSEDSKFVCLGVFQLSVILDRSRVIPTGFGLNLHIKDWEKGLREKSSS